MSLEVTYDILSVPFALRICCEVSVLSNSSMREERRDSLVPRRARDLPALLRHGAGLERSAQDGRHFLRGEPRFMLRNPKAWAWSRRAKKNNLSFAKPGLRSKISHRARQLARHALSLSRSVLEAGQARRTHFHGEVQGKELGLTSR